MRYRVETCKTEKGNEVFIKQQVKGIQVYKVTAENGQTEWVGKDWLLKHRVEILNLGVDKNDKVYPVRGKEIHLKVTAARISEAKERVKGFYEFLRDYEQIKLVYAGNNELVFQVKGLYDEKLDKFIVNNLEGCSLKQIVLKGVNPIDIKRVASTIEDALHLRAFQVDNYIDYLESREFFRQLELQIHLKFMCWSNRVLVFRQTNTGVKYRVRLNNTVDTKTIAELLLETILEDDYWVFETDSEGEKLEKKKGYEQAKKSMKRVLETKSKALEDALTNLGFLREEFYEKLKHIEYALTKYYVEPEVIDTLTDSNTSFDSLLGSTFYSEA